MMIFLYSLAIIIAITFLALIVLVHLYPVRATELALNAERKKSTLLRKEIVLQNGQRHVYLEGGEGEPLMLLHGFGGNKDTFTPVARFLVGHYRLIIPDITGFGESESPPDANYSLSAQVDRLRELSQGLNLSHLHLGGNSMGGQIAMLYSSLYPEDVRSLWLISPSGIWSVPETDVLRRCRENGRNPLVARTEQEYKQVMALGMVKPPYVPGPILKVLAQQRIRRVALEESIFRELLDQSMEDHARNIKTRTLIVFGCEDRIIPPETAEVLNDLITDSKLVFVQNAGHVAMFEAPRQCATGYVTFRESN